jgi:hypothetical protein
MGEKNIYNNDNVCVVHKKQAKDENNLMGGKLFRERP